MSESDFDIQLELQERLPYTNVLTQSLLTLKKAMADPNYNPARLQNIIMDMYSDIPNSWKDTEWREDVKKCLIEKVIDVRPRFGITPLSIDTCKEHGFPILKKVKLVNYHRLKRAIIDLLDRKNMLIRKEKIELSTGENLDIEDITELFDEEFEGFEIEEGDEEE